MEHKVNPKMITLARESRGLTNADLAAKVGVSQMASWYWENEVFGLNQETLGIISKALGYPASFFLQNGEALPLPLSFRKRGKVTKKLLSQVDADINVYRLALDKLLDAYHTPSTKLPVLDPVELGGPQESAKKLRKTWKLAKGPVQNLSELLEDKGIYLCSGVFATDRIDGRCAISETKHPIIVTNRSLLGDRQRFTLAYHLGYLVMHLNTSPSFDRDLSHEANLFAAELLMPEDDIKKDLTELSFSKLPDLKKKWSASMISLVYRADDLGLITPNQKRFLVQQFNEQNIRRREPTNLDVPVEQYKLVRDMIIKYRTAQKLTVKQMAQFMNLEQEEFLTRFKF
jgi:Zn-dependent peptidase ImmA (M78 family)/transcriptional regulator with XRE-family HTH domain